MFTQRRRKQLLAQFLDSVEQTLPLNLQANRLRL
jgi:hypothetical protein